MSIDSQVRAAIYRGFRDRGGAVSIDDLAEEFRVSSDEIVQALRRLAEVHALVLRPGSDALWMAHPFSAIETDFRVTVHAYAGQARTWFANCVWDGLAILALFGDGRLDTRCLGSQTALRFEVKAGQVLQDGLVHFLVPARRFWDDIGFT